MDVTGRAAIKSGCSGQRPTMPNQARTVAETKVLENTGARVKFDWKSRRSIRTWR